MLVNYVYRLLVPASVALFVTFLILTALYLLLGIVVNSPKAGKVISTATIVIIFLEVIVYLCICISGIYLYMR